MIALAAAAALVPVAAAVLGMLLPRHAAAVAVSGAAACAALTVALAAVAGAAEAEAVVPYTVTGGVPIELGIRVDALSVTFVVLVGLVALAVQVHSVGSVRTRYPSFAALVSLFTAAMLAVVLSADLLVLYVGWEVMGACSYLLIGHDRERPAATAAALKAFLMTRVGDVGLLLAILLLGLSAGSFRISAVLAAVPALPPGTLLAAALLLVLGVVAKSGQFPLHAWLPDAMAGPAPVSALIHAATMVAAGVYLVARLYPVFAAAPAALAVLGVLAAVTMLGAALAALAADDLKRLLAYSTVSQLALMYGALAVGGTPATDAALAHLLSHGAFKALLFLAGGTIALAVGATALHRLGGLRRGLPCTFAAATVGFATLAALPPTSGFVSKDGVLAAMWHAGGPLATLLLVSAMATTAVTGAYATRAWLHTFLGPAQAVREGSALLWGPPAALAVPALGLGAWLPGTPDAGVALAGTACAAAGVLAGYLSWRRAWTAPRVLASAFGTDDLYERTAVPGVLRLATRTVRADDGVGTAVRGTGGGAWSLGGLLRVAQTGNPQLYLTVMLAAVVLAGVTVVLR